ncbi:hypothetical protein N7537_010085 [Penicillium hordei]|uniref:Uncharacterized protein n=1 Tax=Penicillium hordei TaxID=40994 RepID=A0AAD6DUB9_9EURO|nr:uncharacterized protein N7537_010085 [Penicillium hordei]KAJ5593181.1 hypothetical protein N7537_010085 [Penicillium hordei]
MDNMNDQATAAWFEGIAMVQSPEPNRLQGFLSLVDSSDIDSNHMWSKFVTTMRLEIRGVPTGGMFEVGQFLAFSEKRFTIL